MSGNAPFTVLTQSHERRHGRFVIQWTEYQMCNGPLTMNEHEAVEALNRLHIENKRLKADVERFSETLREMAGKA